MSNTFIPASKIEEYSNKLLFDYFNKEYNGEITLPIDPLNIAESYLGLTVDFADINENDGQIILGAIHIKDKKIIINGKHEDMFQEKEGFLNFTCAHEIGHWILHVDKSEEDQIKFIFDSDDKEKLICREMLKKNPIEIQADMFAANLLMPYKLITSDINKIKLNRHVIWKDLYEIKDKYAVTISALVNRLNNIKVLYIKDKNIYNSVQESTGQLSLF